MREPPVPLSRPAPKVHRADYRPPAWLVPELALELDLDPQRTRVRARLEVRRNGEHREPLRLDGEGLKLLSVKVDGKPAAHKLDKRGLTLKLAGERAAIETVVEIVPSAAGQKGLFALGEVLCTQCEAENFRRLTFFPDRPDVLARFDVTLRADKARFPVLLANGERIGGGELDGGRHWARWRDPPPKPCYLFALVAGDLVAKADRFTTASGREVDLGVWIARGGDLAATAHAMATLEAAMRWDERAYGREYDLAAYNLVALPGFQFGAMENKGLPIFDAALVLADPAAATDAELDTAQALVAHEYLHNWSGNRVAIRDWFQMALKEGLTVFRDQQFCADQGSAAVKRIEDVRALRKAQFAEDAGPAAHPVRPDSYAEASDLYTPTVYIKGAEIVRMLHTVAGPEAFRAGAELFFARHDGQAATCEDLIAAIGDAGGADLGAFARWYARPGTPQVRAELRHDGARATLSLAQELAPGEPPLPIPLRVALIGAASGAKLAERLVVLEGAAEALFDGLGERPLLSLNRGASAPVRIAAEHSLADLAWLARHDDDAFARHEAMQRLMAATLRASAAGEADHARVLEAVGSALADPALEPGLAAELAALPDEALVAEGMDAVDPARLHAAWMGLRADLGRALAPEWRRVQAAQGDTRGARRLRSLALGSLLAGGAPDAGALALRQLERGPSLTEREGALRALADSQAAEREAALAAFYREHRDKPLLLDKWFSAQALSLRADAIDTAPKLLAHPDFTLAHPARLGAIVGAFAANFHAFHDASGRGYRFLADVVLTLDRIDPGGAARMARALAGWRRLEPGRRALMQTQLERIAAPGLSPALAASAAAMLG